MAARALRTEALCIRLFWGEQRLQSILLRRGESLALSSWGERVSKSDAAMGFQVERDGRFVFSFREGLTGQLLQQGDTVLELSELAAQGLAHEEGAHWWSELAREDAVQLGRGPVWVEAFRVTAPTVVKVPLEDRVDYGLLNVLLVTAGLMVIFLAAARSEAMTWLDDSPTDAQARLRRILVVPPPPAPPPEPSPQKHEVESVPQLTRRTSRPSRPVQRAAAPIDTRGLLMNINLGGPAGKGVLGAGPGIGGELTEALGTVKAVGMGQEGWAIKGGLAGGDGPALERIGDLRISKKGSSSTAALCSGGQSCLNKTAVGITVSEPVACGSLASDEPCPDPELIRRVVRAHRDQLRFCYELALQSQPSLGGRIAMQFLIVPGGGVDGVAVASDSIGNPTLATCLQSRVQGWVFPVPKLTRGWKITYPLIFKRPE